MRVIETPSGEALGYFGHESRMMSDRLGVAVAEVKPGLSWLRIAPSLLRYIWAAGESLAARDGKQMHAIVFLLGTEHPLYQVAPKRLSDMWRPYAWYLRVADLPAFLRRIAPVFEERLASSAVVGYTGSLKLSFYRSGLLIAFEDGRLTGADPWRPSHEDQGAAAFPGLSFLQLLFGYRSLSELRDIFPDCWTETDEAQALLEALFPEAVQHLAGGEVTRNPVSEETGFLPARARRPAGSRGPKPAICPTQTGDDGRWRTPAGGCCSGAPRPSEARPPRSRLRARRSSG
jgi:hypothetical protein